MFGKTKDLTTKKEEKKAEKPAAETNNIEKEINTRKQRLKELEDKMLFFENETKKKEVEYASMLSHYAAERMLFEVFQQLPLLMPENLKEIHTYIFQDVLKEGKEEQPTEVEEQ